MNPEALRVLEARLDSLEKQNQQLRLAFVVVGLVLICVITLGLSRPVSTVEAQRFVLKNEKGEVRAELTTIDGDYPKLTLKSPNGEKVAELSPLGFSVLDMAYPTKLPLGHFGNTGLYFADEHGQVVIELGGASVSRPQLAPLPEASIHDTKGQPVWRVP